jgi:transposase-like protein
MAGIGSHPFENRYKNPRVPVEIIRHAVWLYVRCGLSLWDGEELRLARGVGVT